MREGTHISELWVVTTLHSSKAISKKGGNVSFQTISKSMRKFVLLILMLTTLPGPFQAVPGYSQEGSDRKVKSKVQPAYPEIARRMGLTGIVKIQVVVSPNGTVKETKVIGGHPILVNAAIEAVKKWKFEAASSESTGTLEFRFDPGS
jgi:TonB family protein